MSDTAGKLSFFPVEDPQVLIPSLKERLPKACFVYNQVQMYDNFKDDLKFYTIGNDINSNTWIVTCYFREDYGCYVSISAPVPIVEGISSIPLNIKEALSSGSLLNWDTGVVFVALEKRISAMVYDIAANVKGNITNVHPCILYYMENEKALELEISPGPEVELRRLKESESDFILKTWKYSKENSGIVIQKNIKGAASAGVFVDGKCVSGVITPGIGLISSLYTLKDYRNRGFGKLTMKYAFKENAMDGCVPCSTVEVKNEKSIAFHQSLGVKVSSIVDWIDCPVFEVDVD